VDAIVVGAGTVRRDDPLLTARPPGPRVATRIVVGSPECLTANSQLLRTMDQAPILLATSSVVSRERAQELRNLHCEVLSLPPDDGAGIAALLAELGRRRFTNVLVEGGSTLLGSFFEARAVDEFHVFIAPILLGGKDAVSPIGGSGIERIAEAPALAVVEIEALDRDVLIHAFKAC
jgi:diaminohydroxyphosphoribosylaminopyrimidine deaminase/5-amino-6-(5-phosphoribosylamino)uracil reductase